MNLQLTLFKKQSNNQHWTKPTNRFHAHCYVSQYQVIKRQIYKKKLFLTYINGLDKTNFLCITRYKIVPVTNTHKFTTNILRREIIRHKQVLLGLDKLEIQLLTKLRKKFKNSKECKTFRGSILFIKIKKWEYLFETVTKLTHKERSYSS